jgi:hypothetical protein
VQSPRFFSCISQLWEATFAASGHDGGDDDVYKHPFGPFDPSRGYAYLDRTGYRVPDKISEMHRRRKRPLQRSLTPHLDCCPSALYDSGAACPAPITPSFVT